MPATQLHHIAPPALPPTVLARWQFDTTDASPTTVLPDGCSDLILHVDRCGLSSWHISPLADAAMQVPGCAGEQWLGYRLRPGTHFDTAALLKSVQSIWQQGQRRAELPSSRLTRDTAALEALFLEAIDRHTHMDPRAQEALHALAYVRTVGAAAHSLGVSERSLERLTQRATGRPPRFWRGLARVRRAAQELGTAQPLAEIAAEHGYADQAHFSRDCLRWLGQTPAALRRTPQGLATVAQAGYG
ncbi:MAG: helix-turn-helix domain-containing protein [Gammaproteobacteria bacterium]|nr:helix-turn-helix domain-containing protein [Gammaproteobacteria bacterium]MBU1506345.1 helix-turn-helix domain-containing protein [Gammaproteobacteria bacterium]MBU2123376.1 helix-turn-helix domain-containing protein [Gammaproteobacteria bacterium]MBU2169259.1 helix-turn-helix domain-containing protein [Gammaproteobacteria bacterium]MBU2201410.1 helix-turn-helix domain-containing protein [Gammaproteobacteria bacterium]